MKILRRLHAGGRRVLILSYHRVTADYEAAAREGLPSLLVSSDGLRRQLEHVARTHDIVPLEDARHLLTEGGPSRGADVAAVTFDDGYAETAEQALPVLERLHISATAFVPTGYVGTSRRLPHDRLYAALRQLHTRGIPYTRVGLPDPLQPLLSGCAEPGPAATLDRLIDRLPHGRLLALADALEERLGLDERDLPPGTRVVSWEALRAMQAVGVELGGHTMNHTALTNLALAEARREVEGCRDALATQLGIRPRHFAYPNGQHSPAVRELVRRAGFEGAVTIEDEENRRGGDAFALKRKVLWENTTRGPVGFNRAVATCNLEDVFSTLGLSHPVAGARPDPLPEQTSQPASQPERAAS
ncbi:MAG TPA: polysaccharide deacetylase family protein [Anaeromyxobacter sp.]|nr:polysaccharide deacetylase family protein [Anaeromyxobacter sp.]